MKIQLKTDDIRGEFIRRIERTSGEDVAKCYQCGNCSAGCPVSFAMEIRPSHVIRFLQLGRVEEVMRANTMWVCVGCLQCFSRCPKCVSAANILEALRQSVLRKGRDHVEIEDLPLPILKKAPQQAIVSGLRKFVG